MYDLNIEFSFPVVVQQAFLDSLKKPLKVIIRSGSMKSIHPLFLSSQRIVEKTPIRMRIQFPINGAFMLLIEDPRVVRIEREIKIPGNYKILLHQALI